MEFVKSRWISVGVTVLIPCIFLWRQPHDGRHVFLTYLTFHKAAALDFSLRDYDIAALSVAYNKTIYMTCVNSLFFLMKTWAITFPKCLCRVNNLMSGIPSIIPKSNAPVKWPGAYHNCWCRGTRRHWSFRLCACATASVRLPFCKFHSEANNFSQTIWKSSL